MVRKLVYILSGFVLIYGFTRVFLVDSFIAKGNSMFPAVAEGERIFVDKTLLGPRLYTDYDVTGPRLNSIRLPGRGRLRTGDWVITNYPYACSKDTISFKINYVYLKRCYGAPGETVSIVNGFYRNDAVPGIIGSAAMQQELRDTPDSVLTEQGVVLPALQVAKELGWTIKDFGPLYVPKAGDVVPVSVADFRKYRRLIQYETGIRPIAKKGAVYLGDEVITEYRFRENYVFLGGDNVLNSEDSRYFGLVPESYIVGIVCRKGGRGSLRRAVMRHYRDDLQKRKAAAFLFQWMKYHYSYGSGINRYYDAVDSLLQGPLDKERYKNGMRQVFARHKGDLRLFNDYESITPEWLVSSIDRAFDTWKNGKWACHLDFEEFCEYLLPYKCMELQPLDSWREDNAGLFRGDMDRMERECREFNNNPRVAALEVNRALTGGYLKYTKQLDSYPIFRPATLMRIPYGTCQESCTAALQIMRSKGLPVALDFTPQWANRKYGHLWLSVLNLRHKSEPFSPFEIEGGKDEHANRPMSKVYRVTYAADPELLSRREKGEYLPSLLKNIFVKDVSKEYVRTSDVRLPAFPRKKIGRNIYAATFNNQEWIPVACGWKRMGQLRFNNLGQNVLYLPVQVLKDGTMEAIGHPFFLGPDGNVTIMHTENPQWREADLFRKYPVYEYVYRNQAKIRGGVIEYAATPSFAGARTAVELPADSLTLAGSVEVADTSAARYWRFRSSDAGRCDMAELIFYDKKGQRLSPKLILCGREVHPQNKVNLATAINDDDPLTFFSARGEDDIWVGFDFGGPASLGTVDYFRRSDGNNLYPGYQYTLFCWNGNQWQELDSREADKSLCFHASVPEETLLWLVCNTTGTESRPFVIDKNGQIQWY